MNAVIFIILGAALLLLVIFLPVLNGVGSYKVQKPTPIRTHKSKTDEDESKDTSFVKFQLAEGTSSSLRSAIREEDEDEDASVGQRVRNRNAAGREKLSGKGYDA
ncbi:uncharacterized protein V1513DRAFT_429351 [Lipomyces chichibuensis]|uniref:uncharacterized protein n=1 Tax=Lipomyces chichibuensis TaxID=1546026 RepID=UPI003343B1DF